MRTSAVLLFASLAVSAAVGLITDTDKADSIATVLELMSSKPNLPLLPEQAELGGQSGRVPRAATGFQCNGPNGISPGGGRQRRAHGGGGGGCGR